MMEFTNKYRNRPIKTIREYTLEKEQQKRKGCYKWTVVGGLALIIATHIAVYKLTERKYQNKIDNLEMQIDNYKIKNDSTYIGEQK